MSKQKLTKADLKRMEDLSVKQVEEKKALAIEKKKLAGVEKELEAEKVKIKNQWKELKNAKKQQMLDKDFKAGVKAKDDAKSTKPAPGGNLKKLNDELLEMKTKYNHEGKRARQFKQDVDQLTAENKVLQKKLKNLQGRKGKGEDPRIKHLQHENMMLKKQLRLLMIELNKKRRWFQRCVKSFKSSRQKWIKNQEEALKKKGVLIKYVFLDDVKQIKAFREKAGGGKKGGGGKGGAGKDGKYKTKIKVKCRDGGTLVLKDVEIMVLEGEDPADKGTGGKKKKSKSDREDEIDAMMAEFEKEFELDQEAIGPTTADDDSKDDDSDFDFDDEDAAGDLDGDYSAEQLEADAAAAMAADDDASDGASDGGKSSNSGTGKRSSKAGAGGGRASGLLGVPVQASIDMGDTAVLQAQLVYLKKEMDDRTDDVEKLKEIMSDAQQFPDPKAEVKNYMLQINKRADGMMDKLDKELHADKDELGAMRENNDRWQLWWTNLSQAMARNGALFKQLLDVYECYLKELRGRVGDLHSVNNTFYTDKREQEQKTDDDAGGDADAGGDGDAAADGDGALFGALKKTVTGRHDEVEGEFSELQKKQEANAEADAQETRNDKNYGQDDQEQEALDANAEKVKEIRANLVNNNGDWRELIDVVSTDFDKANAEKDRLVLDVNTSSDELKKLLDLVVKIPQRKILPQAPQEEQQPEQDAGDANEE